MDSTPGTESDGDSALSDSGCHGLDDLEGESRPVLDTATVGVGADIRSGLDKLVDQVTFVAVSVSVILCILYELWIRFTIRSVHFDLN